MNGMNNMNEIWNLPWQTLLKSLAGGIGPQGIVDGAARGVAITQRGASGGRNAAGGSDSWLSRARSPGAPLPTL
jgi:hypothetical protein